jgi:hypothetical protein
LGAAATLNQNIDSRKQKDVFGPLVALRTLQICRNRNDDASSRPHQFSRNRDAHVRERKACLCCDQNRLHALL